MNRIDQLFSKEKEPVLNVFYTAGYPRITDTRTILTALQKHGADMVEIGIPFSDPLADGPVIQQSSKLALDNGMTLKLLFEQLKDFRNEIQVPVIFMGDLNPILQFGMEKFLQQCQELGVDGVILPNLPVKEYEENYRDLFEAYHLHLIFLVTPETSDERIREIDSIGHGFIYAVSSSSTTGKDKNLADQQSYFERLQRLQLKNPVLVGFGIKDHTSFEMASRRTRGAIIGTAYIKALEENTDIDKTTQLFIRKIKEG